MNAVLLESRQKCITVSTKILIMVFNIDIVLLLIIEPLGY